MHEKRLRLDDQLCFALYAATNAVTRAYRPRLAELGLTYPQYLVLLVLWQDGPSPIGHIAGRLKLAHSALTPLLDRLETASLLTRAPNPTDRRTVNITLTAAGEALQASAFDAQQSVECETGLNPADLATLRGELEALVARMEANTTENAVVAPRV